MPSWGWVLVSVVAAAVGVILAPPIAARVRIWLDPQYRDGKHVARRSDGAHAAAGSEASGPTDVAGLLVHRQAPRIRRLAPATAQRYEEEWAGIDAGFDQEPEIAVRHADRLITMAMLDRGYPVDDLDRRASELKARHGKVVATYRAAHAITRALDGPTAKPNSDDLRRGMAHYRDLFDLLVVGGSSAQRQRAG